MQIIIYFGEKLKKSEELRKGAKDDFVNCLNCKHFRCRCKNIKYNIYYSPFFIYQKTPIFKDEYCYICELGGKIIPYSVNEEMTELLIPKDWCPLINKERRNKK